MRLRRLDEIRVPRDISPHLVPRGRKPTEAEVEMRRKVLEDSVKPAGHLPREE